MSVNFRTNKLTVDIDRIVPNRWNPNVMDDNMFAKQKRSIEEIGFLGAILVRELDTGYYEILDGEHRWKALKEAGEAECPVENIGIIEDDQAKLLTVLINNLHGKDDIFKRAKILEALEEGQLSLLPFTQEEIEHEKKLVSFDFSQYDKADELPEASRTTSLLIQLSEDEFALWQKVKEELYRRSMIDEKSKKKQDVQTLVRIMRIFLEIVASSKMDGDKITL